MSNQQVYRLAAGLVAGAAFIVICDRLWSLASVVQDIILLFALAWLITFSLSPLVDWLEHPVGVPFLQRFFPPPPAGKPPRRGLSHAGAVALIYGTMALAIMVGVGSVLPVALEQGTKLGKLAPELPNRLPELVGDLESALAGFGIRVDLPGLYEANVAPAIRDFAGNAFRELMGALAAIAAAISNLLLVIILSLYMSLSGRELAEEITTLFPRRYRTELFVFVVNVNKNFGGFVRGQMFQALLAAVATAVVMVVLRLDYAVLAAILSGVLMLIPLLGVIFSLIPPVVIALTLSSISTALIVFLLLFVFQQVLINVVMPKILSDSVGLHPLLVFGALLVGIRVGGIWGAFFGIPVAGVLYAMVRFAVKQARLRAESEAQPI